MSNQSEISQGQQPATSWWRVMLNNSFQSRFVVGGLVPVVLFYLLHRAGQTLTGAIVTAVWGVAYLIKAGFWFGGRSICL